jgi:hypothetical protein
MAEDGYKPWWAIDKAAWREALSPFYKFASITERRDTPLPPWSEVDVQEFIHSDPIYGPQLKLVLLSSPPPSWSSFHHTTMSVDAQNQFWVNSLK